MKRTILGVIIGVCVSMSAVVAQEHPGHQSHAKQMNEVQRYEVAPAFQQQLNAAYKQALKLNEAFVASDAAAVKAAAAAMLEKVNTIDMGLLKGDAHMAWMQYQQPLQTSLQQITATADIAKQRALFAEVNQNLHRAIKAFGVGETVYYQYCPMYKAGWLSNTEEVNNPYYGSKMLKCGSTKETLN